MVYCNEEKVNSFILNNNFYVIMDFDKTMTTIDSEDSWTVIQNPKLLDCNLSIESKKLYDKYGPIEMDYTLDPALKANYMYEWYTKVLNLYYKYNLTYSKLLECLKLGTIKFKDGLTDLLSLFYKNNIPVIILSAGIGNVIVEFLKLNNCLYDNIHVISNFFDFYGDKLLPFNNPIIHTCNKKIVSLPDNLKNSISNKEYILLFGDFIEDINMISNDDLYKTLSFGFLEKNITTNFNVYTNVFDVVLTSPTSFYDVMDILKQLGL